LHISLNPNPKDAVSDDLSDDLSDDGAIRLSKEGDNTKGNTKADEQMYEHTEDKQRSATHPKPSTHHSLMGRTFKRSRKKIGISMWNKP
jgi:hypothetical protein